MKSGGGGLMPTLLNQGVHLEEMLFTVSKGLVLIAYIIIPMLIEKFFVSLFLSNLILLWGQLYANMLWELCPPS